MLKPNLDNEPKIYVKEFKIDTESGLRYGYINGIKQKFAYSPDSCTSRMEKTCSIKDNKVTFTYYIPNKNTYHLPDYVTNVNRYVKEEITVDIIS